MNIAEWCIREKVISFVLMILCIVAGISAYLRLPRLEDPEFTIKEAQIITAYPGASAKEVEVEVSDEIEKAVQQLAQLKRVESKSARNLSTVTAVIKDKYTKYDLPQIWDELRRKIADAQSSLPPGCKSSIVVDDYGDVYGVFYALTGDGYSYSELKEFAKYLQQEFLLVKDVKKVELFGTRDEAVYIEMSREKAAAIGIAPEDIFQVLAQKNLVANAGRAKVGIEYVPITPTGAISSFEELGNLLISKDSDRVIFLKDVVKIKRGYIEPPTQMLRYNGKPAVGIAISTVFGGNVVNMGKAIRKRIRQLRTDMPAGMELNPIALQSEAVTKAVNGFAVNLLSAVIIVIVVLLIFMGMRSGMIIGFILFMTICGTFMIMGLFNITLERISLGALIISLGMLVDNAIVITEGMMVRIKYGCDRLDAAREVTGQTMLPLLGATAISIIAFAAIGLSRDSTGEYCRALFIVLLISLLMSWVTAITATPLLGYLLLKKGKSEQVLPDAKSHHEYAYNSLFFRGYKKLLGWFIKYRWFTCVILFVMLVTGICGFMFIPDSFFPDSSRPQFYVNVWMPESAHISEAEKLAGQIEAYFKDKPGVTSTAAFIGSGASRFLLTYTPEKPDSSYAMVLVSVDNRKKISGLVEAAQKDLNRINPHAMVNVKEFQLGPGVGGKIQVRFSGSDYAELLKIADNAMGIMRKNGNTKGVRSDWRYKTKAIKPIFSETQARRSGITYQELSKTLLEAFEGAVVGIFRDKDEQLPIITRAYEPERKNVKSIESLNIWSPIAQRMIPLRQVVSGVDIVWEYPIIMRRNRRLTVTVHCDPLNGVSSELFKQLRPQIERIKLPEGYNMKWGGEYEDSQEAQRGLLAAVPFFGVLMVLIVVFLFNSIRQSLVVWLCVPLAIIGVAAGLLLTGLPFGFMALLGLLSLSGMLIKNAIVLIDEINIQARSNGKDLFQAIIDASASRVRPVTMAAFTTVFGMIPLLTDVLFASMAVTIMFGLSFAAVLTLIVVPVFYAIFYHVRVK